MITAIVIWIVIAIVFFVFSKKVFGMLKLSNYKGAICFIILLAFTLLIGMFVFIKLVPQPQYETITPRIVKSYTMQEVDVVKNKVSKTVVDSEEVNLFFWKNGKVTYEHISSSYTGGKVILHDGKQTEFKIKEVRQSKSVKEPTFQLIEKGKKVVNQSEMKKAGFETKDELEEEMVLVVPIQENTTEEAQQNN